MATVTSKKEGGDAVQGIAVRNDGSVRQIIVQNAKKEVIAKGYFPPGTFMHEDGWLKKRMFHWVDAFTDEELLDPKNELPLLNQEVINKLREESVLANMNKQFIDGNIEDYKEKA